MQPLPPMRFDVISEAALRELVGRPDPMILDIGCNDGEHTKWFLDLCPKAKVHAFEPDPRPRQRFKRLIKDRRARLWDVALGATDGEAEFHASTGDFMPPIKPGKGDWDQSGSLRKPRKHLDVFPGVRFERTIKVRTMRLDTFAREQKLGSIDLIWADVQGAEVDLIAGGAETLARTRLLYTEYNDVEMYEGQVGLRRLLELLPDFEVLARWPGDVLLRNRSPRRATADGRGRKIL